MKAWPIWTLAGRIAREVRAYGVAFPLWRLKAVDVDGYCLVKCKKRSFWIRKQTSDEDVLFYNAVMQEYKITSEYHDKKIDLAYQKMVEKGVLPLIIDAGGNIGLSGAWFAERYPSARVVVIEPDDRNAEVAQRNLANYQNATLIQAAIGGQEGHVKLVNATAAWGIETERAADGVKLVTIDSILKDWQNSDLLIVKIDIEGFESDLFSGDLSWVQRPSCIYIEFHDWKLPGKGTSNAGQKALFGTGREVLVLGENIALI